MTRDKVDSVAYRTEILIATNRAILDRIETDEVKRNAKDAYVETY